MTPETFTTQSLAPKDRYEAWQDWFRPVIDVTRMLPTDDEFLAKNVVWKLGSLVMSRVAAPPVRGGRRALREAGSHRPLGYHLC